MPLKGEPLEPRFDRGEIAKNQTYMPPVLVSLLPMECMKRDTIIRWMNAMEWMYNQWTSRASVSKKSASGGEMRISKSPIWNRSRILRIRAPCESANQTSNHPRFLQSFHGSVEKGRFSAFFRFLKQKGGVVRNGPLLYFSRHPLPPKT